MAEKLSRRERQIMDILYERGRCSARDVQDALTDPPSYSAVRTLLSRLVSKDQVNSQQDGQRLLYEPAHPVKHARGQALQRLVSTFFGGSRIEATTALLNDAPLSPDEVDHLQALIDAAKAREQGDHRE